MARSTRRRRGVATAVAGLLVWGCASDPLVEPPDLVESEYFLTQQASFQAGADGRYAYVMLLAVQKPLPREAALEVWMQNPDPSAPGIQATIRLRPADEIVTIRSRGLKGLVRGRIYHTTVLLYSSSSKTELLGSHEQPVLFAPDQ